MEDAELDSVRRLMQSAIQETATPPSADPLPQQQDLQQQISQICKERMELETAKAAWEKERAQTEREKAALAARAQDTDGKISDLEARLHEEQARLLSAQQEWDRQKAGWETKINDAVAATRNAQLSSAQSKAVLDTLQAENRRLTQELEAARQKPAPAPSAEEILSLPASMPTLEPLLDPAWSKIIPMLQSPLANSYAHIRQLALGKLPEGQKALLKLAAGDLVQIQDHLKVLSQFLEGASPPASTGRLELPTAQAISSWEGAFASRSMTIVRKLESPLGSALFHAETLRVVLYQILRNAYEAMPNGACLTVRLAPEETSGQALLSFSDTGPGFSPEALEGLFTPFLTSKKGHLGLGLALTRRMMQSWGGDADAGNGPAAGAVVTLRFATSMETAPSITEKAL